MPANNKMVKGEQLLQWLPLGLVFAPSRVVVTQDSPKSLSFTCQSLVTRKFGDLMSRSAQHERCVCEIVQAFQVHPVGYRTYG